MIGLLPDLQQVFTAAAVGSAPANATTFVSARTTVCSSVRATDVAPERVTPCALFPVRDNFQPTQSSNIQVLFPELMASGAVDGQQPITIPKISISTVVADDSSAPTVNNKALSEVPNGVLRLYAWKPDFDSFFANQTC